ncbi:MAG: DUF6067 family protein [Kiritimatiellae bacterium]|nr:DUF6067 family protein [Kiritimatiellia bacterium]
MKHSAFLRARVAMASLSCAGLAFFGLAAFAAKIGCASTGGWAFFPPSGGAPFTVAAKPWEADGLGNHRAVVRVPETGAVARAVLDWRRTDPKPEVKRLIVAVAETGAVVSNAVAAEISADRGVVEFEPVAGAADYFVYYLPYRERQGSHNGRWMPDWNDYFKPDPAAGRAWRKNCAEARPVACETLRFEARAPFEAFGPTGVRMTAAETDALRKAHPENPVVFTEDRTCPVHPASWLPAKWAAGARHDSFAGTALRDEYYVWQIVAWTPGGAVRNVRLAFSDLVRDGGGALPGASITCINTDGVNWDGTPFRAVVDVPANRVQPLWCGVMVPRDAKSGVYRGRATLTADGVAPRTIAISLTVADEIAADHGDGELWRMSRLRWLNSRIGEGDAPVSPYRAMACDAAARRVTATDKVLTLDGNGLPASIRVNGREVLKRPMRFVVETDAGAVPFAAEKPAMRADAPGRVGWTAQGEKGGVAFSLKAHMEFDGFVRFEIAVRAPGGETAVKDVRLETDYEPYASQYLTGMGWGGHEGGLRPKSYTWNWKGPYDSYWTGGPLAGLHVEFRGGSYHGPLLADVAYHPVPPETWRNGGRGGVSFGGEDGMRAVARSGATTLGPEARTWAFDLNVTPVKPLNEKLQFSQRYYHASPEKFDAAAERGANIANIHHARSLNPVINYPFVVQRELADYVAEQHAKGRKVKLYYTIRELSNHVAEFQALRSLGGEIIEPGKGNGAPWLWEHAGEGYRPAWYVRLKDLDPHGSPIVDASFVTAPHSRWINYYLEGLRWMFEHYRIDGLYMDDVSFDRTVMKRMRRIIEQYRPGALLDLHSCQDYSYGAANQYAEFFPFIDRLWFGEGFHYDKMPPDAWFAGFSGIPFGLMGEMLEGGGNPWLGAVYGTTRRYYGAVGENNPTAIWKAWEDFGIADAKMAGYWEEKPAVATDRPDVKATAFIRADRTLIAIGNFGGEPQTAKLAIDWKRLGIDSGRAKIEAPAIPGFQPARAFRPGEPVPVDAKKGWMLVVSP